MTISSSFTDFAQFHVANVIFVEFNEVFVVQDECRFMSLTVNVLRILKKKMFRKFNLTTQIL